jgi:hypothetical protein
MDFKGQTAVLSAFVLVGMMFLVPTITEKALAVINASASGRCGPEGQTLPCVFTLEGKDLKGPDASKVKWGQEPSCSPGPSCTKVKWGTEGECGRGCDEEGSVLVKVGGGETSLYFNSPSRASLDQKSSCEVRILDTGPGKLSGTCTAVDDFLGVSWIDYNLHSTSAIVGSTPMETCKELKATIAEDELANSYKWKSMGCESLLK